MGVGAPVPQPTPTSSPAPAVRVLRYGGDEVFPPFESLDAQGRPVGFHVDLLAALGRELNATEDRHLLRCGPRPSGAPRVVDGKHLQPFAVRAPFDAPWVAPDDGLRVFPGSPWTSWRLAYRDVSAAGNARSLICALLPPGHLSTHTVFCLRTPVPLAT